MLKNRRNLYDHTKTPNPSSMSEVSDLHLHGDDEDHENDDFIVSVSPRRHHWSPDLDGFDVFPSDLDPSCPEYCNCRILHRNLIRVNPSNPFDQEGQVSFVFDMISHRAEPYLIGGFSVTDSDEDLENEIIGCDDEEDNLNLCWDAFHLEDDEDDNNIRWVVPAQQFEWEEVDDPLNVEPEVDDNWEVFLNSHNLEPNPVSVNDLDWEVFLDVDNIEGNQDLADQFEDYDNAEHEMLFGQFADTGDSVLVQPPASKRVVENLLKVVMTREDVENDNTGCAVCKDEIGVGEMVKQLPCSHYYHEYCIVPWLCIRNTCPVCRYELLTDDINYERRKAERVASGH